MRYYAADTHGCCCTAYRIVDIVYEFLSSNRLNMGFMGGFLDAVIASKRMQMSQKGIETCGDVDEECSVSVKRIRDVCAGHFSPLYAACAVPRIRLGV